MAVYRVSVSARLIDFPTRCACCGSPHDRTVHATAGRSGECRSWPVPYCDRCLRHHEAGPVLREATAGARSATVWLVGCVLLCLASGVLAVASPACGGPPLAVCLVLAGVFWLLRRSRVSWRDEVGREMSRTFRRDCACEGPAVRYEGWSGSVHTFRFSSEAYAADFERLNFAKVVDAPPPLLRPEPEPRPAMLTSRDEVRVSKPASPRESCHRCGHSWAPRGARSAKCPSCGRRRLDHDGDSGDTPAGSSWWSFGHSDSGGSGSDSGSDGGDDGGGDSD